MSEAIKQKRVIPNSVRNISSCVAFDTELLGVAVQGEKMHLRA